MTQVNISNQDFMPPMEMSAVAVPQAQPMLCRLLWRREKLWVVPFVMSDRHVALPALAKPEWFQACLQRSKAKAVVVDPRLGSEVVNFWTLACAEAKKPIYLRLPAMGNLPEKQKAVAWKLKCLVDRLLGLAMLVVLSPAMVMLAALINLEDGGPAIEHYWCVGQRGKLFRMAQFRLALLVDGKRTSLSKLLEAWRLDRLPRLLNVVNGEMALVGTKPWTVDDAVILPEEYHTCLKALPGLVGPRPLGISINLKNSRKIETLEKDRMYLKSWSLFVDGKTGLEAIILRSFNQNA